MSTFWQSVVPAVLAAFVAGRVAITPAGRLRRMIRANVELLGALPADHPSREDLAAHIEGLVDTLVVHEQAQFDPTVWLRARIKFWATAAVLGLVGAAVMATSLAAAPLPLPAWAGGLGAFIGLVFASVVCAIADIARWWRERDLEDDDDQEPDLDDVQATAAA
jgi:hypothetical protein